MGREAPLSLLLFVGTAVIPASTSTFIRRETPSLRIDALLELDCFFHSRRAALRVRVRSACLSIIVLCAGKSVSTSASLGGAAACSYRAIYDGRCGYLCEWLCCHFGLKAGRSERAIAEKRSLGDFEYKP